MSQSRPQLGYGLPDLFFYVHTVVAAVQDFQSLAATALHGPPYGFSHRSTDLCLQGGSAGLRPVALRLMPFDQEYLSSPLQGLYFAVVQVTRPPAPQLRA